MSVSSNYLYHFTDKNWKLRSILEDGVRVSYSLEDVYFLRERLNIDIKGLWGNVSSSNNSREGGELSDKSERRFEFAMPMACFCDIPLPLIEQHSDVYGRYAVGLKKDWGIKKGMNPVSYVAKESDMASALQSFEALTRRASEDSEEHQYTNIFTKIIQLTKPYEGAYSHGEHEFKEYRFYDEREWRYIEKGDLTPLLSEAQFEDLEDKVLRHLEFDISDIEYIIVSRNNEKGWFEQWAQSRGETENISIKAIGEVLDSG